MTEIDDRALAKINLFDSLTPEEVEKLQRRSAWRRFVPNEQILDRMSANQEVFFVVEGAVRVVNYSLTGREVAYATVRAGGYFGELAAIDGEPRSASVVATEDCLLIKLPPNVFIELLQSYPQISLEVMRRLTQIVRRCDNRIMDLSTLTAIRRVYIELLRLCEPDTASPGGFIIRPLPTHSDIAARASTTRETVGRVIGQLAGDGIVERKPRTLFIRDRDRLELLAETIDLERDEELAR
ncbi:MAG: Crp/Fnr family transcriptional regulator, partial [Alphaproteobacteria bacterium]|nr:Crp/Fnr family transcriptional regulator [Alphaproteobacteria bacterium]HJP23501.1 Crp/Fnr family transcriptional regulator [Alphaproteobacteria bacterium]